MPWCLNLRFRDPSLTSPQIIVALLLQTYLLALVGEIRGTIMVAYCLILLFGVFQMSRTARSNLRGNDIVARFGGEEFVLLLDNCDLATLHHCVERIRQGLATHPFSALPEGVRCTMSAGICLIHPEDDLEWRISQADEALYQAKAEGRNRTCAHEQAYA